MTEQEGMEENSELVFSGAFAKFRKATITVVMFVRLSVRPYAWNNSAPTGQFS